MARQNMNPQPWRKNMEAYQDFSGGLNTKDFDDTLQNNELTELVNISLGERGSLKRRHGMVMFFDYQFLSLAEGGNVQGLFSFYSHAFKKQFYVAALEGLLYRVGIGETLGEVKTDLDASLPFQTTRLIEAVQYEDELYIATGSFLAVVYTDDGVTLKVRKIVAHKPKPLEALYIGTNALADNPDQYLSDGEAVDLRLEGVTFDKRYGVVNEPHQVNVYVSKPTGMTVEYRHSWAWADEDETSWRTWGEWRLEREFNLYTTFHRDLAYRFQVREAGDADSNNWRSYIVPLYKMYKVDPNEVTESPTIHNCNRILLHKNRIMLYGDPDKPTILYFSHLQKPDYFPMTNTLDFKDEDITKIVQYRDLLVCFSNNRIQALYGSSPTDFRRIMLNSSIGCIAPETAKVVENNIMFLSADGVHTLKSIGITEDKANVQKLDTSIANEITRDKNACAEVHRNQYHLVFPDRKVRFRLYYSKGMIWAKDVSEKFNFHRMIIHDHQLFGLAEKDFIYLFDETVWHDDGHVYTDKIGTKYFDFSEPYNPKKLKELQLLMAHQEMSTQSYVTVYADSDKALDSDESYASVDENGNVVWNVVNDPNLTMSVGTKFGEWNLGESAFGEVETNVHKLRLSGKCYRMKLVIEHKEATPHNFLGFATVFKTKRP